jgi:Mn2+/Fe2+ NRAMP family transporter
VDPTVSSTIGINGYVTLTAGVVLMVFAGLMMVSDDSGIRIFASLFALATVGLGIYVVVRLLQKINEARVPHGTSVNLGWGAMLLLGAAVVGALVAISELRAR